MQIQHTYELQILEHHLDTFGHVNNATYLELFEEARWDLIEAKGLGMDSIKKTGIGPVILEVNVQYKKELRNREKIRILTRSERLNKKLFKIHQSILNEQDVVCCSAVFTAAVWDLGKRKIVEEDPKWLAALGIST